MSAMDFYKKDLQRIARALDDEANRAVYPNWDNVADKLESLDVLVKAARRSMITDRQGIEACIR